MVASCEALERDVARRFAIIPRVLAPLSPTRPRSTTRSLPGIIVVAAHGGSVPVSTDHRTWRFPTVVEELFGGYYEAWLPAEREGVWRLDRAYLTLYLLQGGRRAPDTELLALHCDPYEPESSPHWRYKRGPHLHIERAEPPLPRSHFALNMAEGDAVLASIESLTEAVERAVVLLREEVLNLYLPKARERRASGA